MRGAKETRPCAACGKPLTRLISQARGANWYCDHVCQATHAPHKITLSATFNPQRGQQDTRPCANCGTPVTRYLSQARSSKSWTCSRSCKATIDSRQRVTDGTWKRPQKPRKGDHVDCRVCGKSFYRQPAYIKQGRFLCSRACNALWQARESTEKPCAYCGKLFRVAPSESFLQTCSRSCQALNRIKRPLDRTHNGKPAKQDDDGYVYLWEPSHPNKSLKGWQAEHRLVAESVLGRYLRSDEHVDHINQIKDDNRPENLQVLSPSDHSKKTNADNLGALKVLRAQVAEQERAMAEQEQALAEMKARLATLESSTD